MSCVDHECHDCYHQWFDNSTSKSCPKCGSTRSSLSFDEPMHEEKEDLDEDWWEEDEEEDEEEDD